MHPRHRGNRHGRSGAGRRAPARRAQALARRPGARTPPLRRSRRWHARWRPGHKPFGLSAFDRALGRGMRLVESPLRAQQGREIVCSGPATGVVGASVRRLGARRVSALLEQSAEVRPALRQIRPGQHPLVRCDRAIKCVGIVAGGIVHLDGDLAYDFDQRSHIAGELVGAQQPACRFHRAPAILQL